MNVSKTLRFATALTFALALSACGAKSIDLQKAPQAPAPQAPPSTKPVPGNPANPSDPAQNPEKPERPQPLPGEPVAARYRLICEVGGGPGRTTFISTDANSRPFDPFADLYLGSFSDSNQSVTRSNYNIVEAYNPVAIPGSALDRLDLLFTGVKLGTRGQRLFQASADTVLRTGKAADLGSAVSVDRSVRDAAEALGLAAANYGVSETGRFLLLPLSSGFKIVSRDRTKTVGTISTSVSKTILPRILESKGVFTALVFNGRGFSPVVWKLSISSSSVSVSKKFELGFSGSTSSLVQSFDSKSLAWVESSSVNGGSSVTVAKLDLSSGRVARASYRATARGARIYPQAAITQIDGSGVVNLAVESVAPKAGGETGAVVSYARVITLAMSGSSLSEGSSIEYPDLSLYYVQEKGLRGPWIIKTLMATADGQALLGTFTALNEYQAFRERGGSFEGVGSAGCLHPDATEVKQ
jgi:hypothetical protein